MKAVNLTLVFSRKYRWPEHYFSVWCLGNSQKLLKTNQFLVSTIFFTIMNISFFNLRFDLFSIIAKEFNQVRNNVVSVVAHLVYVFCCALTTGRCNGFQQVFVIQKKSEFYVLYFQTILFHVTMAKMMKKWNDYHSAMITFSKNCLLRIFFFDYWALIFPVAQELPNVCNNWKPHCAWPFQLLRTHTFYLYMKETWVNIQKPFQTTDADLFHFNI